MDKATKLIEYGICTDEELALVEAILGCNDEAWGDILYVRTGLRSFDQLEDD